MSNPQGSIPKANRLFSLLVLLLFAASSGPGEVFAETLYAKSNRTKMHTKTSPKSPVVATLKKGTPVNVLTKGKRFYKVSVGGKKGWIFKFKLTSKQPSGSKGGGGGLNFLLGEQKIAAAESSSGSSIRGLSPVSEKYAKNKGISQNNIDAVKQMETFKVNAGDLEQFLEKGRLGEFAK